MQNSWIIVDKCDNVTPVATLCNTLIKELTNVYF